MVQFIFEGSRTNFSFWSKFAYVLVRTGVHPTCPSQKESEVSLQKYSLLCTQHKKEYFWWGGWGRITLSSGDYI